MDSSAPKWRRRKTARPGEIIAAAIEVFAEKGFAAARLDDIAARAGVSKGALYLYFETKADLFEAVVREAIAPDVKAALAVMDSYDGRLAEIAPAVLARLATVLSASRVGGVAKMVIGESRNFPDLAKIWRDAVIGPGLGALTRTIAKAQARGEVSPGDPRLYAFSLLGPMVMSALWREVVVPAGGEPIDVAALAAQHGQAILHGILSPSQTETFR
jgi:AcrR family transcriptional regulator